MRRSGPPDGRATRCARGCSRGGDACRPISRHCAARRSARAAAPVEEACAARARQTDAQRAARAAAPAEEKRATQARDTAARRDARAAAPAEETRATQARNTAAHRAARAPHGVFCRAAGENMPSDAFLDNFDVDPVTAVALHHALQYHWQGEDFRNADFNALDGQQLVDFLSMPDKEGLPDHIDVARRMTSTRTCGCCSSGTTASAPPITNASPPTSFRRTSLKR